jgi:D-alanyl-lipoteichoic acid acyltransferase DltB (MBOAT superfamily)
MLFNSLTFIVFFVIVVTLYWGIGSWTARKNLLVVASYLFYGAWNPPFAALLFSTTAMDFWLGRQIAKAKDSPAKRRWLVASVCMNLSMLGFFKYGNFLLQNFQWLVARIGIIYQPPHLDILLPVGISFYTFHSLSYTLDIYRGVLQPTRSLRDFILAVSFFPQLVAGPIVRAGDFLPQLVHPTRLKTGQFLWGLALMTLGLFEKIVLADTMLSGSADRVFDYAGPLVALDSWAGVIAFAGQIFFDFAGYSTCAIGAALTLGFHLKDNFRFPYAAIGFSDFWRRWHIVWGLLHGTYLVIERVCRIFFEDKPWANNLGTRILAGVATYAAVCIAWVYFRASDFTIASRMLAGMFGQHAHGDAILSTREMLQVALVTIGMISVHCSLRDSNIEIAVARLPRWVVTAAWALMACAIILTQGTSNAFIYFQF